ncbi:MAG: hypothetical protein COX19_03560 [Desulfobacterales bacterium CG23_combo_of_CG06-09_8_20_14_all_51_8]|nr:MAG: hypothetical protein COX19_03560 [Desulfobacterales bacterium CG23_combo_of_CG06-09_8_20_14_all_51_8]
MADTTNNNEPVKSRKTSFSVITAQAVIQYIRSVINYLDPGLRRGDDFLWLHQYKINCNLL